MFAKVGVFFSTSTFPSSVFALSPDGSVKWEQHYPDGAQRMGLVQGPARDIYTIVADRLVALQYETGTEFCVANAPVGTSPFGTFVGNFSATFSSFWDSAVTYDANCTALPFWTTNRGIILRLLAVAGDFVVGADADLIQGGASDPKLFAVNTAGQFQWRNNEVPARVL